jgi:hypothetical protein
VTPSELLVSIVAMTIVAAFFGTGLGLALAASVRWIAMRPARRRRPSERRSSIPAGRW